jgi:hypothetical protein
MNSTLLYIEEAPEMKRYFENTPCNDEIFKIYFR